MIFLYDIKNKKVLGGVILKNYDDVKDIKYKATSRYNI